MKTYSAFLNEGYEKHVSVHLDDAGIDHHWENGVLHVYRPKDVDEVHQVLDSKKSEIYKKPPIVHQRALAMESYEEDEEIFRPGTKVRFKPEHRGSEGKEVFTIAGHSNRHGHPWIEDKQGRGWYTSTSMLEPVKRKVEEAFHPKDHEERQRYGTLYKVHYTPTAGPQFGVEDEAHVYAWDKQDAEDAFKDTHGEGHTIHSINKFDAPISTEVGSGSISEEAPPGMEDWIKKNKARFKARYGAEKGEQVLYATAWKLAKDK